MAKSFKKFLILGIVACLTVCIGIFAAACNNDPEPETYVVTFDRQGHGTTPSAQEVEKGGHATKPNDLTEDGWDFGGWYKEATCTNEFVFTTEVINADTTIYAKWTEAEAVDPEVPETSGAPLHFYDTTYDGEISGTAYSKDNLWNYTPWGATESVPMYYNEVTVAANSAVKIFWHIAGYEAGKTYKFDIRIGENFQQTAEVREAVETWYSVGQGADPIYKAQAAFGLIGMQVEFTEDEIANAGPNPMCNVILQNTSSEALTLRIVCAVGDAH